MTTNLYHIYPDWYRRYNCDSCVEHFGSVRFVSFRFVSVRKDWIKQSFLSTINDDFDGDDGNDDGIDGEKEDRERIRIKMEIYKMISKIIPNIYTQREI